MNLNIKTMEMTLTDKALISFEKWLKKQPNFKENSYTKSINFKGLCNYKELPDNIKSVLYVEWLDSVKIYISTIYCELSCGFDYLIKSDKITSRSGSHDRMEALSLAIQKGNEIYNTL